MKAILLAMAMTLAIQSQAETTYLVNGKEVSKLEAVKAGMNGQKVFKMQEVQLTDKLTFKAVKKIKADK